MPGVSSSHLVCLSTCHVLLLLLLAQYPVSGCVEHGACLIHCRKQLCAVAAVVLSRLDLAAAPLATATATHHVCICSVGG